MKRTLFVLAIAFVLAFGLVTSSSAWVYVPDFGSTGWKSFSFTSTQAVNAWDLDVSLTFGVKDSIDNAYKSTLLVDNVKIMCNFNGSYEHFTDSFESAVWTSQNGNSGSSATQVMSAGSYNPTDGSYMAQLVSTIEILKGGLTMHGPDGGGSFGPTVLTFDWAFLAGDYMPFDDYSYAILTWGNGATEYFELGKIGAVPEPTTLLLLGLGFLGLASARRFRN